MSDHPSEAPELESPGDSAPASAQRPIAIGTMSFCETDTFPVPQRTSTHDAASGYPRSLVSRTWFPVTLTLASARQRLPFPLHVPTWAPEGFTLDAEVRVVDGEAPSEGDADLASAPAPVAAHFRWAGERGGIAFSVNMRPPGRRGALSVAPGSVRAVQVGSTPAALLQDQRGFSPQTSAVVVMEGLVLRWEVEGLMYELRSRGGAASAEELIRMAESLAPPDDGRDS